ncbi:hypothetical protein FACS189421_11070 [Bacteroidia bacterium]|nr:hypothetical protein FACS189421_11070 [Bacteroidia bacterium]
MRYAYGMIPEDYRIFPIFNQTPEIWGRFYEIQHAGHASKSGLESFLTGSASIWKTCEHNFAFGAYELVGHKNPRMGIDRMVGFVSGYKEESGNAYVQSIRVLPELRHQKLYIGQRLMRAAETAMAADFGMVGLHSNESARHFYESPMNGYVWDKKFDDYYSKKISGMAHGKIIPLFNVTKPDCRYENIVKTIQNKDIRRDYFLNSLYDGVNQLHRPAWACVDERGVIRGFVVVELYGVLNASIKVICVDSVNYARRGAGRALNDTVCDWLEFNGFRKLTAKPVIGSHDFYKGTGWLPDTFAEVIHGEVQEYYKNLPREQSSER